MTENRNTKHKYDLEERTFKFAKDVRVFVKTLPHNFAVLDDLKQLVRASGSVGANYIEANEALSKKDFLMRVKISRKESKECIYWLRLLNETISVNSSEFKDLIQEATELKKILSAIIEKSK